MNEIEPVFPVGDKFTILIDGKHKGTFATRPLALAAYNHRVKLGMIKDPSEHPINILGTHPNFVMPEEKTASAAGYDISMVEAGVCGKYYEVKKHTLGFKMEIPVGFAALILPRSSVGFKFTVELCNTVGLIDADYRGEVFVKLRTKDGKTFKWEVGDRLVQMIIVPIPKTRLVAVDKLSETERGTGGLGSTGQ